MSAFRASLDQRCVSGSLSGWFVRKSVLIPLFMAAVWELMRNILCNPDVLFCYADTLLGLQLFDEVTIRTEERNPHTIEYG